MISLQPSPQLDPFFISGGDWNTAGNEVEAPNPVPIRWGRLLRLDSTRAKHMT